MLMDQLFMIAMTCTGFGWQDLMELEDCDRLTLVEKANEYWDEQKRQLDKAKS